jgi:hypothetical protein
MEVSKGIGFFKKDEDLICVCSNIIDEKVYYIYKNPNNNLYYEDFCVKKQIVFHDIELVYDTIEIFAFIKSIEDSVSAYGNKQRRADLLGSSLRVLNYAMIPSGEISFSLQTDRPDALILEMLECDLEFLLPTISCKRNSECSIITENCVVKALINDKTSLLFNKGDQFEVIKIDKNESFSKLNILTLRNIVNGNIVNSYQKYFKLI